MSYKEYVKLEEGVSEVAAHVCPQQHILIPNDVQFERTVPSVLALVRLRLFLGLQFAHFLHLECLVDVVCSKTTHAHLHLPDHKD